MPFIRRFETVTHRHLIFASFCLALATVLFSLAPPLSGSVFSAAQKQNIPIGNQKIPFNIADELKSISPCTDKVLTNKSFFFLQKQTKAGEVLTGCINTNVLKAGAPAYIFPKFDDAHYVSIFINLDLSKLSQTALLSGVTSEFPKSLSKQDGNLQFLNNESKNNNYQAISLKTLNFKPGKYTFVIYKGSNYYFDTVVITEPAPSTLVAQAIRADMKTLQRFALYDSKGKRMGASYTNSENNYATLKPNTDYFLAVDLGVRKKQGEVDKNPNIAFDNTINVDFYDNKYGWEQIQYYPSTQVPNWIDSVSPDMPSFLNIQIDQTMKLPYWTAEHQNLKSLTNQIACGGAPYDISKYPDGIAIIPFTAPAHHPYYEEDGKLRFRFYAAGESTKDCTLKEYSFLASYDDSPATKTPISVNTGAPFETFKVRLVRIGNVGLIDKASLEIFAKDIEENFAQVTKKYFALDVTVGDIIKYSGTGNAPEFQKIMANHLVEVLTWYAKVPKVPGKQVLDLSNTDEFFIATILYFEANPEKQLEFLKKIYPAQKNGEYLTFYLVDGLSEHLGSNVDGNKSLAVQGVRIFPTEGIFYKTTPNGVQSYMVDFSDKSIAYSCGNSVSDYLKKCLAISSKYGLVNTIPKISTAIHEFGHVLWKQKDPILYGFHPEIPPQPSVKDQIFQDNFALYLTRNEIMSYGRDRSTMEGVTLGDVFLEDILKFYGVTVE